MTLEALLRRPTRLTKLSRPAAAALLVGLLSAGAAAEGLVLNARPLKQEYCVDAAMIVEVELINKTPAAVRVDAGGIASYGSIRTLGDGVSGSLWYWRSTGYVDSRDERYQLLQADERIRVEIDVSGLVSKPLGPGEYVVQVQYRDGGNSDAGLPAEEQIVYSDRVVVSLRDCMD